MFRVLTGQKNALVKVTNACNINKIYLLKQRNELNCTV